MPIYKFKCSNCSDEREYIVKMLQKVTTCQVCGGESIYQNSFLTVSTGLPNGHIAIRSKVRKEQ